MRTNKITKNIDGFLKIVKESYSVAEVARRLGYKQSGGVYKFLKLKFKEYGIDTSRFKGQGWSKGMTRESDERVNGIWESRERKWNDLFRKDSCVHNYVLLRRLVSSGKRQYRCFVCGNSMWQGKPLRLHLHHINGDNTDNEETNLDLICPNCHVQTETFARGLKKKKEDGWYNRWWIDMSTGKNQDVIKKEKHNRVIKSRVNKINVSNDELINLVSNKNIIEVGKILNISSKSVMKLCRIRKIEIPTKSFLRKKFDVSKEEMIGMLKEKPILQIGKLFGVSDNAIRKRCETMGIDWKSVSKFSHSKNAGVWCNWQPRKT